MLGIVVTILVEPTAKGRPRTFVRPKKDGKGYFSGTYTPKETREAENDIKIDMRRQVIDLLDESTAMFKDPKTPLFLQAIFYRARPKSLAKKAKLPVSKPDLDNYTKLLTDALEKYVYANDSQITTMVIAKRYGDPPRIELWIKEDTQ